MKALLKWLLRSKSQLEERLTEMARTAEVITQELIDTKTKFDAYKTTAEAKFAADAATITDLKNQLANTPPAQDLTAVDAASADLAADVAGATVPQ